MIKIWAYANAYLRACVPDAVKRSYYFFFLFPWMNVIDNRSEIRQIIFLHHIQKTLKKVFFLYFFALKSWLEFLIEKESLIIKLRVPRQKTPQYHCPFSANKPKYLLSLLLKNCQILVSILVAFSMPRTNKKLTVALS